MKSSPTSDQQILRQLSLIADRLDKISHKLEQLPANKSDSPPTSLPTTEPDITQAIDAEINQFVDTAIHQITGSSDPSSKPIQIELHDPDQLSGWSDSIQQSLGAKPPYPTSNVRKLDELIVQLSALVDKLS